MNSTGKFLMAFAVWAMFIPVLLFMPMKDAFSVMSGVLFTTAGSVLHAYWPALGYAFRSSRKRLDYVDFLTLGILCVWLGVISRSTLLFIHGHQFLPLRWELIMVQYVLFAGGLFHLAACRIVREDQETANWGRMAVAVASGVILGVILSVTN